MIAQSPQNTSFLVKQANQLYQAGRFTEAVEVWRQVAIAFASQKNYLNQAMALSNLSLTYQQLGEWEKAKTAIAHSLKLLKTLEQTTTKQRIYAQTLDIQGQLQQKIGQSQPALESWQQAAKIYAAMGDNDGVAISEINQAQTLQDLGLYPRACKTLLKALGLNNQECQLLAEQFNPLQQKLLESQPNTIQEAQARGLRSLGNVFRVVGKLEESEKVLQTSLGVAKLWNLPQDMSKVLLNLGNTNRALATREETYKDEKQAKIYRKVALDYYQQSAIAASPLVKIQAQLNQRDLLIDQQQRQAADSLLSPIRESLTQLPLSWASLYAKINFAKSLIDWQQEVTQQPDSGSVSEAISLLKGAINEAKILEDERSLSYAFGTLGKLYADINQNDNAKTSTQQALQAANQIRASDLAYQWQWQLGQMLRDENREEAIAAYGGAINSLKNLRGDLVSLNSDVQFDFKERVEPVYREYVDLLLQPKEPNQETLKIARQTIEDLQLAELDNFFQEACTTVKPQQIDQVDANTAVIYSVILPERLEIILSLPGKSQSNLRRYTTSVTQKQITETVTKLQNSLNAPLYKESEILLLSQQVYNWLMRPLKNELDNSPQVQTLVFVLDGVLQNIPMAVLHDGQEYLIEKNYAIALTPGLQLLDPKPLTRKNFNLLAAGLSQARTSPVTRKPFSALPNVTTELKEIQPTERKRLLDDSFTSESLEKQVNSSAFSAVHIATHGEFSSRVDNTFILAWDGEINTNKLEDVIKAKSQPNRPIELLVLSACKTAKGDNRAALGLAGVAVRAGARSTLASLWVVRDDATAILMKEFYGEFTQNQVTKAKALQLAQRAIRQNQNWKHPYFWTAFVLVGNWL
ncbi:CHAT domain-containing protein [Nostoc sp. TCL26-01]|uniref:CHAT domain-containing protein n=1 Tax=Nostoc sp. TCL26-01 TaxID=2576904 RepID=UPI0015C085B1|nr:CHAT domain-containing protein [Nostoc sp. TCL26-01]